MPTYSFQLLRDGQQFEGDDLKLRWEVNGSPMFDQFLYEEADEHGLWRRWVE